LAKCIISVYDSENVYEPDNLQDAVQFLESLNNSQFSKIMQFINTMPKLRHTFTYKCKGCGQEDTVTLEGMSDFF
jgi:predicted SprT family Zn-dependent metalloprotease